MSRASARLAWQQSALARDLTLEMTKFLNVDLALGLTFATAALGAPGNQPKRRERNRINAQKALDAVVRHRHRANLPPDESAQIDIKINRLRLALERLDRPA